MSYNVYYDFEAMIQTANQIREIAKLDISDETLKLLETAVGILHWEGQAADAYRTTTALVVNKLRNNETVRNGQTGEVLTSKAAIELLADLLQRNATYMQEEERRIARSIF